MDGEKVTIRHIREAIAEGLLKEVLTPTAVNHALGIEYAGVFLAKHRVGNPGGFSERFIRLAPGKYRLR